MGLGMGLGMGLRWETKAFVFDIDFKSESVGYQVHMFSITYATHLHSILNY